MAKRRSHTLSHGHPGKDNANWTIGDYVSNMPSRPTPRQSLYWATNRSTWAYATKRGWTVRTDPQGFVYCIDPKTGNKTYAKEAKGAVWGYKFALDYRRDIFDALLAMYREP